MISMWHCQTHLGLVAITPAFCSGNLLNESCEVVVENVIETLHKVYCTFAMSSACT